MSGLAEFLRLIQDGEPVSAGTPNRPLRQLHEQLSFVWDALQASGAGQAVYARRVVVDETVVVGTPVYFDREAAAFAPARAEVEPTPSTNEVTTSEASRPWGVVAVKHSAAIADVLVYGFATLDFSAASGGDTDAGTYYLSSAGPGLLTRSRPSVGVPVLRATGDGRVLVSPQLVESLDRHAHYSFPLHCLPAGAHTPPAPGGTHEITSPDEALPGWLPAGHASFDGAAPDGAVFGYNLAADPALDAAWPPLPAGKAHLEWDRGETKEVGGTGVPSTLCRFDSAGIWWFSDCAGDVPWPADLDTATPMSESDSGDDCPRRLEMALTIWFSKLVFNSDSAPVRSLSSDDPRVVVLCADGSEGSSGDLKISLDLAFTVSGTPVAGGTVLKSFDAETGVFSPGPVVEGLYSAADNVTLSGTTNVSRLVAGVSRPIAQGLVRVDVAPADTRELDVQLIRLDKVENGFYADIPYLAFPAAKTSEYRGKIHVPADTALTSLSLRFRILGRSAGTLPQLVFTRRSVPRPAAGLATPLTIPAVELEESLACPTQGVLVSANQYVEAESSAFAVEPGDVVFFTVRRSAADGYPAELGVVQQVGILSVT